MGIQNLLKKTMWNYDHHSNWCRMSGKKYEGRRPFWMNFKHFQTVVFSPVVLTDLEHISPGGNENHHILGVPHCCKNHSLRHIPGTLCGPFSFLRTIYQHTSYASDS